MSVASPVARIAYTIASLPATLALFEFDQQEDVLLLDGGAANATSPAVPLVLGSDYTVTGGGYNAQNQLLGGSAIVIAGGASDVQVGDVITIVRNIDPLQETTFASTGLQTPLMIESDDDKVTTMVQQLIEEIAQCLKIERSESPTISEPLLRGLRRGKILGFDGTAAAAIQYTDPVQTVVQSGDVVSFNSYTAARALSSTGLVTGSPVTITGYASANDGGAGPFTFTSVNPGADNNGTILALNDGLGWLLRNFVGPARPEWFGGIPSVNAGGGADCSAAFTAALALNKGVQLSAGHYKILTKISRNTSNCSFLGINKDLSYVDWYGAGVAIESYVAWGGSSLGYIKWGNFTLTDFGSGTTKGFHLGLFTLGCSVDDVKIVSFDYGVDVENAYYSNFNRVDFSGNGVGMQFTDRCNTMQLFACKFVTDATPANTSMHLKSAAVATATSYGLIVRDCFFDGQGTAGLISMHDVQNLVIEGCYFEVYAASAFAITAINLGVQMIGASITKNMMIGPSDNSWTGKWIYSSDSTSNRHTITQNRQFRASGASFLTTTSGNYGITYDPSGAEAPDGTIVAGSINMVVQTVGLPATTGSTDLVMPAFKMPSPVKTVRVLFTPSDAVDLTNRFLRVDTIIAGVRANILNYDFNNTVPNPVLDLGETVDCGSIGVISANVQLLVYIYKVGTALVAPACTVAFEYYGNRI